MKLSIFSIVLFFVAMSSVSQASPNLSEFTIVFEEEFSEPSLNPEVWNTGYLWGPYEPINQEEQLYVDTLGINAGSLIQNGGQTPNPFELTGSTLKIIAHPVTSIAQVPERPPEGSSIWNQYPEYRFNGDDPDDANDSFYDPASVNYLSGLITSYDSFRFTHGYAEARVKLPAGKGLWSAFWLSTSFYVEDLPEIDIVESLGDTTDVVYHTYHYFESQNDWKLISTPSYETEGYDFTSDWHTFSVSWDPKEIIWYVDGLEAHRITESEYTIANQAMYLLANLAVGGSWPGSPESATIFPAEYEIDYIRVYEKNAPETISQLDLDSEYHLMFSDEFSGVALDTSKWNTHHLWGPYWQINKELQFYPDVGDSHAGIENSPISVENGLLKITARSIEGSELPSIPDRGSEIFVEHPEWRHSEAYLNSNFLNPAYGEEGHDASLASEPFFPEYTSGILTTYDSFKFVNGYAEIRVKLPEGEGLWPAFWLLNGYYVDEQPEIDVVELRGGNPGEAIHSYHLTPSDDGEPSTSFTSLSDSGTYTDEFHTFGIAWEPGKLEWYIDGSKQHTLTGSNVPSQSMYAILNLAVGGNFVAPIDAIFPVEMEVDYVRIYQLKNEITLDSISDDTAPVTEIQNSEPSPDGVINMGVVLSGSATDEGGGGVDRVRISIKDLDSANWYSHIDGTYSSGSAGANSNNALLSSTNVDATSWQFALDLPEGNYRAYASSVDGAGNVELPWKTYNFVNDSEEGGQDLLPPESTVLSPSSNSVVYSSEFLLLGKTTDSGGTGISRVRISIRDLTNAIWYDSDSAETNSGSAGGNSTDALLTVLDDETVDWQLPVKLPDGKYRVYVSAIDNAKNIEASWAVSNFSVQTEFGEVDTGSPTTTIAQPNNVTANLIRLSGSTTDDGSAEISRVRVAIRDLDRASWYVDSNDSYSTGSAGANAMNALLTNSNIISVFWQLDLNLPIGSYRIYASAIDAAGNVEKDWKIMNFSVQE